MSHAAPAHHFRDAGALLAALAARGFERLSDAMRAAMADAAPDPAAQFVASAVGYLRFGTRNPALLQLMFGPERPPDADPELQRQGNACFAILTETLGAFAGPRSSSTSPAGSSPPPPGRSCTATPCLPLPAACGSSARTPPAELEGT